MPQFTLVLGALAATIEKQLEAQGLTLIWPPHAQTVADMITRLAIAGLLTDAEKSRICRRLIKKIRVAPIATK